MNIFNLTLRQMLMMFFLILCGFILRKKKILPENAHIALSRLETYIFVPALTIFNLMTQCTVKTFAENYHLILYGTVICLLGILLSYPLSRIFVPASNSSKELVYQRNVYKYAMAFGNYGFMGNFIILGVWGNEFFYKYTLFTFGISILCYAWGLYILIPKEQNASFTENLKKGLLTPPIIGIVIGMAVGLLNLKSYIPDFVLTALDNAGACQGPVAMILAGFVIGGYNFKELLTNKKVYFASLFRLVFIPALLMVGLSLINASEELMILALIAFATPLGLNTIVFPAAYGGETKTGASMAMISHTLAVVTIPLMYLVFIAL